MKFFKLKYLIKNTKKKGFLVKIHIFVFCIFSLGIGQRSLPPNRISTQAYFDDDKTIMTGRQDITPVASVKAETMHKDNSFQVCSPFNYCAMLFVKM